ncbi:gas vesicle protein GvpG [Streptomyces zhihengii]|uniref:Gas vesicle protein GvpG n=1 Tax=Streptomyces zhihengii TaxID=1818004 RepID=A0ABS2V0C5_9ACTN|nr:gas vesicle protein GvpG [Streptomyces zhihengii]MBM9623299.1 gas vesicle protein GvpG [Streptomyces zhihengii]
MGMFTQLVTLPLAPVRGVVWVSERVLEVAEDQYYDPEPVHRALADLERRLLSGEIDEEAFDRLEDELLDRLDEIKAHRAAGQG